MISTKRFVFFLLILLIILSPGCQRSVEEKRIQLRVAMWGCPSELPSWKEAIKSFTDKYPGIKVSLESDPYKGYEAKILTQMAGGVPPDIIEGSQHMFFRFQKKGILLNLAPLIKEDKNFSLSDFFPEAIEPFIFDGKIHSIPFCLDLYNCLFYNKDLFRELGLPFPKDNWTWDEFVKVAQKLTLIDEKGRVKRYGFTTWHWGNFVYSNGGRVVDNIRNPRRLTLDESEAKEAIQFFIDLIHKYKVMPPPYSMERSGPEMFMTGQVGMCSSGIGIIGILKDIKSFDWDMTRLPKGPKAKHSAGSMGYVGFGISEETKHPKEAYKLLKFLTSETLQRKRAKMFGSMPPIERAAKEFVESPNRPHNKRFLLEEVEHGKLAPFSLRWAQIFDDTLIPGFHNAIDRGTETLDEALREVLPKANELLQEE